MSCLESVWCHCWQYYAASCSHVINTAPWYHSILARFSYLRTRFNSRRMLKHLSEFLSHQRER